eukprot:scaffold240856_cov27-Tisochrysis_lutea.AAC.2
MPSTSTNGWREEYEAKSFRIALAPASIVLPQSPSPTCANGCCKLWTLECMRAVRRAIVALSSRIHHTLHT